MSTFFDVRKIAAFACLTSALSFLWPAWTLIHQVNRLPLSALGVVTLGTLLGVLAPVFYGALWANRQPLRLDEGLRNLSQVAAIVFGILMLMDLPKLIASVGSGRMTTLGVAIQLAGEASNLALLLLLVALYLVPAAEPSGVVDAGFLDGISRVYVMVCGLYLVYTLSTIGGIPYMHLANRGGLEESQIMLATFTGPIRGSLSAACIFAAPYIVAMSLRMSGTVVAKEVDAGSPESA